MPGPAWAPKKSFSSDSSRSSPAASSGEASQPARASRPGSVRRYVRLRRPVASRSSSRSPMPAEPRRLGVELGVGHRPEAADRGADELLHLVAGGLAEVPDHPEHEERRRGQVRGRLGAVHGGAYGTRTMARTVRPGWSLLLGWRAGRVAAGVLRRRAATPPIPTTRPRAPRTPRRPRCPTTSMPAAGAMVIDGNAYLLTVRECDLEPDHRPRDRRHHGARRRRRRRRRHLRVDHPLGHAGRRAQHHRHHHRRRHRRQRPRGQPGRGDGRFVDLLAEGALAPTAQRRRRRW